MKQKFLTLILLLTVCIGTLCASDTSVDGIWYYFNTTAKTATVTYRGTNSSSYNEYSGEVIIPENVTYNEVSYSVTSIGSSAFSGCSSLTSVTIPNSVTSIGSLAFSNCSALKSVTIPSSVKSIGASAFASCTSLKSISIPKSVTSFGTTPFYGCSNITSIEWNVKKAGDYYVAQKTGDVTTAPFYDIRSQIVSFTFGEGVQHIPAYICYGMSKLVSVSMPSTLLSIGKYAFCGCSVLSSIILPSSVNEIGSYSFWGCSSLAYITCKANTPPKLAIGIDANCFPMEGSYALKYLKCSIPCGTLDAYKKSKWDSYMRDFIEETIYSLTLSSGNPSSGVAKLVSRPDCESAIITAIPNEGCTFVKWSDGNTQATRYVEVTEDISLTAYFAKEGYTIHVYQDCNTTIE